MKCKQNKVWTLKRLESLAFCMRVYCFLVCILYYSFSTRRSSLLYIVVWKRRWRIASTHAQKESFEACWSPMIFCLIWLLSYEGSISNSFLVWRNISAGRAVILVLLQSTTKVVEKVVVQFVHLSFFNTRKHPKLSNFISRPLLHFFTSLATLRQD